MNNKLTSQLIAVIFVLLTGSFAASVSATVYYLDATNGDNSWNGEGKMFQSGTVGPWRTLSKITAFSASPGFLPGDQILLKRGETFRNLDYVPFVNSGDSQSYIEFGAYGTDSEKPILQIQTAKLVTHVGNSWFWEDQDPNNLGEEDNHVWLYTYKTPVVGGVWKDNVHLKHATDLNSIAVNEFFWVSGTGIYYRPDDNDPTNDEIYRALQGLGLDFRGVSYIRLSNLHFSTGYRPLTGGSSTTSALHHVIIENCEFDNTRTGILLSSAVSRDIHDITIQNNTFTSNGRAISITSNNGAATSTNIVIKKNLITDTDANHNFADFQASKSGSLDIEAIGIQNANDSEITGNEITIGATHSGIIIFTDSLSTSNNNIIARNVIHDIEGAAISLFGTNTPDRNIGNIVHNNIIYNCTDQGAIRLSAKDASLSNSIYNNTIVNCGNSFYINGQTSGFDIFNNISLNPTGHHIQYNHTVFASVMNNNIYYPDSASSFLLLNGIEKTLAEWKFDTGQDAMSVDTDPLLADINANDFHLTTLSSAAIDTGIFTNQAADIENNPILSLMKPDIGAYEFGHNDSDGDGVIDYDEICYDGDCQNYNPYDSATNPSGGDLNLLSTDSDSDGYSDSAEISAGTNPISAASIPTVSAPAMGFTALLLLLLGLAAVGLRFSRITFR